jgi:hypothetical protein
LLKKIYLLDIQIHIVGFFSFFPIFIFPIFVVMNQAYYTKTILISLIAVLGINFYASAQNIEIKGLKNDVPTSIALDANGDMILAGYTKSFDDGSDQAYLVKIDDRGDVLWEKTMGDIYGDRIFDICIDDDQSLFITGESWLGLGGVYGRENMFVAELDEDANLTNQRSYFGYHRDMGLRIKEVDHGNHIVVGYTKSMADKTGEIMIVKVNPSLDTIWKTILGEPRSVDYGFDMIESENTYLVIGSIGGFFNSVQDDYLTPKSRMYMAQLDFDGHLLWEKKYGGEGHDWIEQAVIAEGGVYAIGSTQSIGNGSFDMLLLKTDLNGDSLFAKSYGEAHFEHGRSIVYHNHRLFLGGQKKSDAEKMSSAIYLVCTDMDGQVIWEKTIESTESDKLVEMVLSKDGQSIYCLAQSEHSDTHKDFWLFNMDLNGNISTLTDVQLAKNNQVYPNPVSTLANIDVADYVRESCKLMIYNEVGQLVSQKQSVLSGSVFSFLVTNLNSGFYTYRLDIGDRKRISGKFIVR